MVQLIRQEKGLLSCLLNGLLCEGKADKTSMYFNVRYINSVVL